MRAISNVPTFTNTNTYRSKGQVKLRIGIISPESNRTEHQYSALLSTGADDHNSDGRDDLTDLVMVVGDVVASAHKAQQSEIISWSSFGGKHTIVRNENYDKLKSPEDTGLEFRKFRSRNKLLVN